MRWNRFPYVLRSKHHRFRRSNRRGGAQRVPLKRAPIRRLRRVGQKLAAQSCEFVAIGDVGNKHSLKDRDPVHLLFPHCRSETIVRRHELPLDLRCVQGFRTVAEQGEMPGEKPPSRLMSVGSRSSRRPRRRRPVS